MAAKDRIRIQLRISAQNYTALADLATMQNRSVSSIVSILICTFAAKMQKMGNTKITIIMPKCDILHDDLENKNYVFTTYYLNVPSYQKLLEVFNNPLFGIQFEDHDMEKTIESCVNAIVIFYRNSFETEGAVNWLLLQTEEDKKSKYFLWKNKIDRKRMETIRRLNNEPNK